MSVNTYDKMFYKGPESALPEQTTDGKILFTTDTGKLLIDGSNERTEISDFIKGMTEDEIKAQLAPLANKVYISSDTNKFMIFDPSAHSTEDEWTNIANSGMAQHADMADTATHADTSTYAYNAGTTDYATNASSADHAVNADTATYAINAGTATHITNGVKSIASGTTNGSINVNINGSTSDVAVKGLKALAYKDSLDKSDVGLGSVVNIDQSKAIASITRSGTTFTATALDGTTSSFTQQDNNTTYTGSNGITLSGTNFINSGVRAAATGTTDGTININTNGSTADVAVKNCALKSDITTLQTNFQAGVDSVYNAIVAQGTTPASKSLSDVVTGIGTMSTNRYNAGTADGYATKRNQLTGTYTPTGSGGSKLDMGSNHKYRYVNTNTVYNSGTSAGYTSGYNAGTTDGYNTKKNSLTGTYTPGSNGSKIDMGADHTQRYINTNTVYNAGTAAGYNSGTTAGYNSKVSQLTATYKPSSNGSKLDMGSNHNNRYVNTNTVYNAGTSAGYNSGTTAGYNSGTTAGYNSKVSQLTATYTPTGSGGSKLDMGSNHNNRYVNTNTVYNTGTAAGYNSGTTAGYNSKVSQLTATYKPSSNGSKLDMGSNHNNRYVNTNTVYNAGTSAGYNSGTTAGYNTKKNSLTGTYTPTSRASKIDMGADHTMRYVNTNSVPNSNSGTYTFASGSTGATVDMGSTNSYRYVNATNVYNKGKADGTGGTRVSAISFKGCSILNSKWSSSLTPTLLVANTYTGFMAGSNCPTSGAALGANATLYQYFKISGKARYKIITSLIDTRNTDCFNSGGGIGGRFINSSGTTITGVGTITGDSYNTGHILSETGNNGGYYLSATWYVDITTTDEVLIECIYNNPLISSLIPTGYIVYTNIFKIF